MDDLDEDPKYSRPNISVETSYRRLASSKVKVRSDENVFGHFVDVVI